MHALEPAPGWRVVATIAALDGARWQGSAVEVLRIAADEALGLGATGVDVADPDAIVEPEVGFSIARLSAADLQDLVAHTEWAIPDRVEARTLLEGKVAGVPVKLLLGGSVPPVLAVQTCHVDDLRTRLGW